MHIFADITKADPDERVAVGIASTDAIDNQGGVWDGQPYDGDIVDPAAIQGALADYMEYANIREMHDAKAAGTAVLADVIDGKLQLAVKVADDGAWAKVKAGVYKGFSIGGRVLKAVVEKLSDGRAVRRILALQLTEISLVDRPANPDAKIIFFKGATMPTPDPEVLDAVRLLASAETAKASADPQKIVTMLQQARNDAELAGDLDSAALWTQAIALTLQASGDATPTEDEDADPTDDAAAADDATVAAADGPADDSDMMMQAAKAPLKKAGRMLNGSNMAAMQNTVKAMLQMLATAGDPIASKCMKLYMPADDGGDAAPMKAAAAELQKAVAPIADLAKALIGLDERLKRVEGQPADGGPVLRRVEKALTPNPTTPAPATPAGPSAFEKGQMETLRHQAMTARTAEDRAYYLGKLDELNRKYS